MKIYHDPARDLIFVEGTAAVWPARSLVAVDDSGGISIMLPDGVTRVLGPMMASQVEPASGPAFSDVMSAMSYLTAVFSVSRSDVILVATAPVFAGYAVMFDGAGGGLHAEPTAPGYVLAGIATQNAASAQTVVAQKRDLFTFSGWAWEPGEPVFAGPGGTLTQSAPDSGVSHQVGTAIDADTLLIDPGDIIQL